MSAYATEKSLFPSAGCSSELIEKPVNQGKAGANGGLCAAEGRLARKPKPWPPPARSRSLLAGT